MSTAAPPPPSRPPTLRGTRGNRVGAVANVYKVSRIEDQQYFQFDVVVKPLAGRNGQPPQNILNWKRRFQIVHHMQMSVFPDRFPVKALFDGRAIMLSSQQVTGGAPLRDFDVAMGEQPQQPGESRGVFRVSVSRTMSETINARRLIQAIEGGNIQATELTLAVNLLQMIISQAPNMKYANNGRAFFSPVGKQDTLAGLELWAGFFHSVRLSRDHVLINVDVSMSAVYTSGFLINVACQWLGVQPRDLRLDRHDQRFLELRRFLIGINVVVRLSPADEHRAPRERRITGLVPRAGRFTFPKEMNGGQVEVSVADHFWEAHNLKFDPDCFGVRIGESTVIPAEYCFIPPKQLYKKKIPPRLMDKVLAFSKLKPADRMKRFTEGIGSRSGERLDPPAIEYRYSTYMRDARMEVEQSPLRIEARIIRPPSIHYAGSEQPPPREVETGSWNLTRFHFQEPAAIRGFAVVYFHGDLRTATEKARHLLQRLRALGMSVRDTPTVYQAGTPGNAVGALEAAMRAARGDVDFILVIVPWPSPELRSTIKLWGDVTRGVVTQCMRADKPRRPDDDQYYRNMALKVNAKCGGVNSLAGGHILSEVCSSRTMLLGLDVSHPGVGSSSPSIAGVVFTTDITLARYQGYSQVQAPRTEKIEGLREMAVSALRTFSVVNHNRLPQRIFVYRDGLSDGELERVALIEHQEIVGAAKTACQALGLQPADFPLITYVVVSKRHHIRFFPSDSRGGDKNGNPLPGFVADRGIDSYLYPDFYLVSHAGLLGTSRPSHYIVMRDRNFNFNADQLQEFSYALCFMYAKSTRSVSIPAPVYYADLLCARGAYYFDPEARLGFADDSDSASMISGAQFDLQKWKDGYRGQRIAVKMFFL